MKAAAISVAALFLLLTFASVLQPSQEPDPMAWLAEQDADGIHVIEAVLATGGDPRDWNGRDLVARLTLDPEDPVSLPRTLYTLLAAGGGPVHTINSQPVSTGSLLRAQQAHALQTPNDAAVSWMLLAWHATDLDAHEEIQTLRERLLTMQLPSGAWQCDQVPGPECTAFAVAALSATGILPADAHADAQGYLESRYSPGEGYLDERLPPNAQTTAWSIHALRQLGAEIPQDAMDFLASQQHASGAYLAGGQPSIWATAEVVTLTRSEHPLTSSLALFPGG